jgi:hypothetical protein
MFVVKMQFKEPYQKKVEKFAKLMELAEQNDLTDGIDVDYKDLYPQNIDATLEGLIQYLKENGVNIE